MLSLMLMLSQYLSWGHRPVEEVRRLPTIAELYHQAAGAGGQRPGALIRPVPDVEGRLQLDVETVPGGLRRAAEAQSSPQREIVLLTTDSRQLDIAVNLVANLAAVDVHNYLVIGAQSDTCTKLKGMLACVWSSMMAPFRQRFARSGTNEVRTQWLIRQIFVGRLAAMGFSPMLLDADVILFANPFRLIESHLPGYQAYFLGDSSAGWLAVNGRHALPASTEA